VNEVNESKGGMGFFVYILRCSDGSLYVGHTADLDQRLAAHNAGRAALFTRMRRPVVVAYFEQFTDELDAIRREAQIKKWSRSKKEALVSGDLVALHEAARRRG